MQYDIETITELMHKAEFERDHDAEVALGQ
jgi:hypothetical protein